VREGVDGVVQAEPIGQLLDEELLAVGIAVLPLVVMGGEEAEGEGEEEELPDLDELFLEMQQEGVEEEGKGEGMVSLKVEKKEEEKNTAEKEGVAMMEMGKGEEEEGEEKDGVLTKAKKEEEEEEKKEKEKELDELFLKELLEGKKMEMWGFEEMFWTAVGVLLEVGKERGMVSAGLSSDGSLVPRMGGWGAAEEGEGEGKDPVPMEGMTDEEVCLKIVQFEERVKYGVLEEFVTGLEKEAEEEGEEEPMLMHDPRLEFMEDVQALEADLS
jgi:hypothetical protein